MKLSGLIFFFLICTCLLKGQSPSFDSFISRLSGQYEVDVAIAPELIPMLDSIKNFGPEVRSIEDFLHLILQDKHITYQLIDGNKVLLRKETSIESNEGQILITGTVVDKRDHTPLPFSAIGILNTPHGTNADENGRFNLYADQSATAIQISYLGYKPVTVPLQEFKNGNGKVEMEVDNIPLEQVVIIVPFHHIVAGNESVDLKGYQFISSDDFLYWSSERLITQLTGYTHFSSEEGIRIRSGEKENSLVLMDGIPVYDPYHFYNIFSPFNGHYFPTVNLYKNNLPVEHGGRIDGLIELNSVPNIQDSKLIFDTDLLLTSAAADVSITKKIKLTAGGRFSHTNLLNESLRNSATTNFTSPGGFQDENEWTSSQEPKFNFYDINLGVKTGIGKNNEISLAYFHNKDYLENIIRTDLSTTVKNHEVLSVEQRIESRDDWQNEGVSAGLKTRLNDQTMFQLTGFISTFEKDISYNALLKERFLNMPRTIFNEGFQNSDLQSMGLKTFIHKETPENSGYTIGADFQKHEVDLIAKENTTPYLLEVQEESEATLFGEYSFPVDGKLIIAAGGRLTYLSSTSHVYPQPNVRVNYLIDHSWKLKSSFSKNIQAVRELSVENRFGREVEFLALSQPDAGYPVLRSDKYMVGAGYSSDKFSVDGEVYFKKTNGLISVRAPRPDPSFNDATSPGEFYRLFTGDGWTAGLDLLAVYKARKSETSLSYTLSKISQQFDRLFSGNEFSPKEDRRHQVKLTSQYKMGAFIASGLINYKTKAPYVSFIRLQGQGGLDMADQATSLEYLPAYFSMDLAIDYSFRIAGQTALLGASVINVTDHQNINDIQHIGRISRGDMKELFLLHETELLGRTLNMHFRLLLN